MKKTIRLLIAGAFFIASLNGGVLVVQAAGEECLENTSSTSVYCNYPKIWAEKYDAVTLSSNQLNLVFDQLLPKQKTDAPGDFQLQGSAFAGDYVIYSAHSTKNQNNGGYQYVYVENIATGKRVEIKSKEWWHIHAIWYSFDNNRFRINGKRGTDENDDCYEIVENSSLEAGFELKAVRLSECGVKKPKSYSDGLMRQGGTKDQSSGGPYEGYTFYAYSDGGASATSQKFYYAKNNNAVIVHDKQGNIVKTILIPASVVGSELEGVSTDQEGNMYLSYGVGNGSLTTTKRVRVYKVMLDDFRPVETEPEPVETEPEPVTPEPEPVTPEPEPVTPEPEPAEPEPEPEPTGPVIPAPDPVTPEPVTPEPEPAEPEPEPTPESDICADPSIATFVKRAAGCSDSQPALVGIIAGILNAIIGTLGTVCAIVIVCGGWQYMVSAGAPEKIKKAKDTILYAVIGLIVCALAFAIVNFVISKL